MMKKIILMALLSIASAFAYAEDICNKPSAVLVGKDTTTLEEFLKSDRKFDKNEDFYKYSECENRIIYTNDFMGGDVYSILRECPSEFPFRGINNSCVTCSDAITFDSFNLSLRKNDCLQCSDTRIWDNEQTVCRFKNNPCPEGFMLEEKIDFSPDKEGIQHVFYRCISCDSTSRIRPYDKKDLSCPNREMTRYWSVLRQCPSDKPLKANDGCYACDDTSYAVLEDEKNNSVCPEREIINDRGYKKSILKQCPADKPLKTTNGCVDCENAYRKLALNGEDCLNVCSGLFPMPDVGILEKYKPENERDSTEKAKRCFSCEDQSIGFFESDCIKCPNRVFKEGKCLFKEIPADDGGEGPLVDIVKWLDRDPDTGETYMWGYDPRQYEMEKIRFRSCKTPYSVFIAQGFEQEAEKCQNRSITTSRKGGKVSYLTECPAENPLRNKLTMSCLPCDIYRNIDTTKENCSQCPDREYKNGLCIPQKRYTKDNEIMTRFGDLKCNDIDLDYLDHVIKEDCNKCPARHYIEEENNRKGLCVTEKYLQERQAELEKSHQETLKYLQILGMGMMISE